MRHLFAAALMLCTTSAYTADDGLITKPSPSYSGGMHFELTGMAQSVEPA